MIPHLVSIFGAERVSYFSFGLSQILFPLGFIYANENNFNPVQTSLVRGFATMMINLIIIRYYKMSLDFKYDVNFNNLIRRNVTMVLHGLVMATAQFYLPMPIVFTISCSAPVYIFVIDYFENGITVSRFQFYSLVIGVLGVICTINDQFVMKLIDPTYQKQSLFQNYISMDPKSFSIYAAVFCGVMFIWAYALLRVRTFYKQNHTHVNFHFGLLLVISSGILYPMRVLQPVPLYKLALGVIFTGVPLGLSALFFVAGLGLNKKTGTLIILTCLTIIVGYIISYVRYRQIPNTMELIGSFLILLSIIGVIKCGDEQQPQASQPMIASKQYLPPTVVAQTGSTIRAMVGP